MTALELDAVIADLQRAFPPGLLAPAGAFDAWGTTYLSVDDFERRSRGETWRSLSAAFLEFHHDALFMLDSAAFAAYLPAYLRAVLLERDQLDALPGFLIGALSRRIDDEALRVRFDRRVSALDRAQRAAVAQALEFLASHTDDSQPALRRRWHAALDSYWSTPARET